MKKKSLVLATALLLCFTVVVANGNNTVPDLLVKEVQQKFSGATDVAWKTTRQYHKATVAVQGHYLEVFYNLDGSFIGVSRNISVDQLPLVLRREVKEKTAYYYVSELFELVTERGTEYFITYNHGPETKVYKGSSERWNFYQASTGK